MLRRKTEHFCVFCVKLEFIELAISVTFLCPNKKVTKEIVRGEALRANAGIMERLPLASDLF